MKKLIAILLLLCMIFALAACGGQPENAEEAEENTEPAEGTETAEGTEPAEGQPTEGEPAPAAAEYKLGMGVVVSTASSSSEKHNAQVDATVAVVVLDAEGKIVACRLDCAQNKMDVTEGQVDAAKAFQTKVELKEGYNMVAYSDATLEWYEQAANFEEYVIGKTAEEVAGIETVVNESGHTVAVDETLYASCSISIADFKEAIAKACADDQAMTFTAEEGFTVGLAAISTAEDSTPAGDEDGSVKMYTEFAAVVLDKDGKILADLQDAIQPKIAINAAGEIGETSFKGTKRELKEGYNMVAYSDATLEWYQQAANFAEFAVGKTAADLGAVETVVNEEGHEVFADETLHASVSISVDGMIAVLLRAMEYAR